MSEATDEPATAEDQQSSFEAALAAAMGATDAAVQAQQPAPAVVETKPEVIPPAPTAPVTAAPVPEAPTPAQLERAAALEAREAKLRDAEARAAKLDAREAEIAARAKAQWESFYADPVGHIRAMRPELSASEAAQVAERFYFDALGDKAPPEHRQRQEVAKVKTEVRSEVDQLRAEIQELRESRARAEQEAQLASYRSELRSGAASVTDAPIVAGLIQRNPARAEEMLFEVARMAAIESRESGATDPVVLTPAEAAAKLEAILKAQRDELYGPSAAAVTQPNVQQATPSPTITNRDASIQPSRQAPDPDDDLALRKAALEAAGLGHIPVWK